jgi:hypothetical protein
MPAPPAFLPEIIMLHPDQLVPTKLLSSSLKHSPKYRQIKASLGAVGLIEPIVVFPAAPKKYLILDGHVRVEILKEQGITTIKCLVATDDEAYTYNKKVNTLSTVQEHQMILKAIKNGVSEARIATSLNVNIASIRQKRNLLNGICTEAGELLKHKHVTVHAFRLLKRMKAYRQIEAAELMIAARTYSVSFTQAILAGTKPDDLLEPDKQKRINGLSKDQVAHMQHAMSALQQDLSAIKDHYGNDALTLSITVKYLTSVLNNKEVKRYLAKNHADLLAELHELTTHHNE